MKGGRCEKCQGAGTIRIEMHFLPDVYITCDVCKGRRYNRETLEVRYKGRNIHEVLEMTIEEALAFFRAIPPIAGRLKTLVEVGLGYVRLGQSALTLSGGEAQRVKLSLELSRRSTGRTFYILDEPTTGLHFADVKKLMEVLQVLVDNGNTIVLIEHNLDVIRCADWVIDLGPEGGDGGGTIVAEGTPETVARAPGSHTGRFLLEGAARGAGGAGSVRAAVLAAIMLFLPIAARAQELPLHRVRPSNRPTGPAAPTAAELDASTLAADIASASFYELVAWCRTLGIDDTGSRAELQQKLARALKVELPAARPAPERTVTVRSAKESQYFTLTEVDQKYVTLTGDVVVEVRDEESGAVHAIRAARLLYNQSLGVVTAEGGVGYTLTRGGKTESFEGDSLSFDLESAEAVFYDGKSSKTSTRNGAAVTYFFNGETISRLGNDTVVMEKGSFSSCDLPSDPHYQIRAKKVWILAPGEWAIQSAVLFVGRIPLLYLPVFFWPGDRMFFNPALGYREREGTYVQTTTYLLGTKEEKEDNPLSFLKLEETGSTAYDLELHGLFLRKVTAKAPRPNSDRVLKLMIDAYSRLGVFAGLDGQVSAPRELQGRHRREQEPLRQQHVQHHLHDLDAVLGGRQLLEQLHDRRQHGAFPIRLRRGPQAIGNGRLDHGALRVLLGPLLHERLLPAERRSCALRRAEHHDRHGGNGGKEDDPRLGCHEYREHRSASRAAVLGQPDHPHPQREDGLAEQGRAVHVHAARVLGPGQDVLLPVQRVPALDVAVALRGAAEARSLGQARAGRGPPAGGQPQGRVRRPSRARLPRRSRLARLPRRRRRPVTRSASAVSPRSSRLPRRRRRVFSPPAIRPGRRTSPPPGNRANPA